MLWLQCKNHFNDVAMLDEMTGYWKVVSRTSKNENVPSLEKMNGTYSMMSDVFVSLFHLNGDLFVLIDEKIIKLSENVQVTVNGTPEKRCMEIIVDGRVYARHEYTVELESIKGDITAFIDDEDFDFGVFLSNISRNPIRQSILKEC